MGAADEFATFVTSARFQATKWREGYDQDEVDDFLDQMVAAGRRVSSPAEATALADTVLNKKFQPTKFREGYDQDGVDHFLDDAIVQIRALVWQPGDAAPAPTSTAPPAPAAPTGDQPFLPVAAAVMRAEFGREAYAEGYPPEAIDEFRAQVGLRLLAARDAAAAHAAADWVAAQTFPLVRGGLVRAQVDAMTADIVQRLRA